jgi:hypothetical protein
LNSEGLLSAGGMMGVGGCAAGDQTASRGYSMTLAMVPPIRQCWMPGFPGETTASRIHEGADRNGQLVTDATELAETRYSLISERGMRQPLP